MARRIKLHSLHILFHLFAFLADRTGGWRVFVKPKILLGSLLMGIGLTATGMSQTSAKQPTKGRSFFVRKVNRNATLKGDTLLRNVDSVALKGTLCYGVDIISGTDIISRHDSATMKMNSGEIYDTVDQMPQYPGGLDSLFNYISDKTTPRVIAQCYNSLVGTVVCRFVVEKDGSLSHIEVIKSLYVPLDKEAVEIIKGMPNWIPGRQNGNAVRVHYTLPIKFRPE